MIMFDRHRVTHSDDCGGHKILAKAQTHNLGDPELQRFHS